MIVAAGFFLLLCLGRAGGAGVGRALRRCLLGQGLDGQAKEQKLTGVEPFTLGPVKAAEQGRQLGLVPLLQRLNPAGRLLPDLLDRGLTLGDDLVALNNDLVALNNDLVALNNDLVALGDELLEQHGIIGKFGQARHAREYITSVGIEKQNHS